MDDGGRAWKSGPGFLFMCADIAAWRVVIVGHSSLGVLGCLVIWCLPHRVGKGRKKLDLR